MIHFHKWSGWAITESGQIQDYQRHNVVIGTYLIQHRHCFKCDKTQLNKQTSPKRLHPAHHLVATTKKESVKHDRVS